LFGSDIKNTQFIGKIGIELGSGFKKNRKLYFFFYQKIQQKLDSIFFLSKKKPECKKNQSINQKIFNFFLILTLRRNVSGSQKSEKSENKKINQSIDKIFNSFYTKISAEIVSGLSKSVNSQTG